MKQNNYFIYFSNMAILASVLFFKWRGDMTFRFSAMVVINSLHGHLYSDNKLKKYNRIISSIFIILVFILGFVFDYYEY